MSNMHISGGAKRTWERPEDMILNKLK
jgi:hypothetical protein